jgi:hypothetical protein
VVQRAGPAVASPVGEAAPLLPVPQQQDPPGPVSSSVLRRLFGKQPAPAAFLANAPQQLAINNSAQQLAINNSALAAEAWTEVTALAEGAQRQHIHYTHIRTHSSLDRQPDTFTRKQFFQHLEKCYAEAFPEPANPTGSILLFGGVAKEFHAPDAGAEDECGDEHHHAPTYNSKRHFWKKVADISHQKYRVKLNAVAHDGYYSMYSYITRASSKKPLAHLDGEVFLSEHHPRGKALKKLLDAGEVHARASAGRKKAKLQSLAGDSLGLPAGKRIRAGDVYGMVAGAGSRVRTALDLQALAEKAAGQGDFRLAEFCTAMGEDKLERLVHGAVSVVDAPRTLNLKQSSRMMLLRQAAAEKPCVCNGVWIPGVLWVLGVHGEDVGVFCRDVCRALEVGARRGTNIAIVGKPGCGKSMPFEPFDGILPVMGKPESKSSFPLAGALDARVLLWQDYKHSDSIVLFEDILSLVVGELMEIRTPCKKNIPFRNNSPFFFTSNSPLRVVREDPEQMCRLNEAMTERFCARTWTTPLPAAQRIADFPRCSRCCANFYLMYR